MLSLLKKSNVKIIVTALLFVFCIGAMAGCSSSQKSSAKTPSVSDIEEKVKKASDISEMKKGDSAKLKKLYDINSDDLEGFALYTAPTNIKAEELLILKVKDTNNVSSIKDKIAKRIDKQSSSFKDYLPNEYYIIQKNVVKAKDKYVLFVISKDADKISAAFDEVLK